MWSRIKRVSRLDRDEILELKQNKNATGQAVAVLVVAALALGVGYTLFTELQSNSVSAYGIIDRKSTRLNSSHVKISYAVFCLKKKKHKTHVNRSVVYIWNDVYAVGPFLVA